MITGICPPKVSVIIPIYKVEDCLSYCLDSCKAQNLFDVEFICVDDGSPDACGEIAEKYAAEDYRFRVIHQENKGLSGARNTGIRASKGDLIMFLDSDDCLESWACSKIWEQTMHHPADIIVFGSDLFPKYFRADKWLWWTLSPRKRYYDGFTPSILFDEIGSMPFVWRQAFRRSLLDQSGVMFDESVRYGEDVIFQMEIFPYARFFSYINERAYCYRWNRSDSLMNEVKKNYDDRLEKLITVVDHTAVFWNERGLMEQYGAPYLDWALEYILSEMVKFQYNDLKGLAQQFQSVLESQQVLKYRGSISLKGRRRFRQLESLCR